MGDDGKVQWPYQDGRGITVYSYPESKNGGKYIPKPKRYEAHMEDYFGKMLKEIEYSVIPELSLEIRDFLKYTDLVHDTNLVKNKDNIYNIDIKLKEYNLPNVKNVFSSLVQFIQYTSTFYIRVDKEQSIDYSLITQSKSGMTFYCRITFS